MRVMVRKVEESEEIFHHLDGNISDPFIIWQQTHEIHRNNIMVQHFILRASSEGPRRGAAPAVQDQIL